MSVLIDVLVHRRRTCGQRSWSGGPRDLVHPFDFFLKPFGSRDFLTWHESCHLHCATHAADSPGVSIVVHKHSGGISDAGHGI